MALDYGTGYKLSTCKAHLCSPTLFCFSPSPNTLAQHLGGLKHLSQLGGQVTEDLSFLLHFPCSFPSSLRPVREGLQGVGAGPVRVTENALPVSG